MKVLYLFNNNRFDLQREVKDGRCSDDHLFGMLRVSKYGVQAECVDIENVLPAWLASLLRKLVNVYYIHLPIFWKFLSYDIVFTATAFGSQFVHTVLHLNKPRWIMYDFSILGLIGDEKTLRQKMFKWMVGRCGGIITLGERESQLLKEKFPNIKERIQHIPFGVDTSFFSPRETAELNQVLTVGLAPDRDYKTLFVAMNNLNIPLVMTRSRKVDALKDVPEYATARAFTANELVEEYSRSKVVVLPLDISDGLNNAAGCSTLVEAMAMGKAVIVTRTPTTESYVTHGVNGLLVEPHNIGELRSAIQMLMEDEAQRLTLGRNAREFAVKNCNADESAKKMANFFQKCLSR